MKKIALVVNHVTWLQMECVLIKNSWNLKKSAIFWNVFEAWTIWEKAEKIFWGKMYRKEANVCISMLVVGQQLIRRWGLWLKIEIFQMKRVTNEAGQYWSSLFIAIFPPPKYESAKRIIWLTFCVQGFVSVKAIIISSLSSTQIFHNQKSIKSWSMKGDFNCGDMARSKLQSDWKQSEPYMAEKLFQTSKKIKQKHEISFFCL